MYCPQVNLAADGGRAFPACAKRKRSVEQEVLGAGASPRSAHADNIGFNVVHIDFVSPNVGTYAILNLGASFQPPAFMSAPLMRNATGI